MLLSKKIIFILAVCFLNGISIAQQVNGTEKNNYRVITWDFVNGFASKLSHSMLKDINGFLWIGSSVGLSRFDGSHFVNYGGRLIDDYIRSLIEDSLHNIWIGTQKGLSRYDIRAETFSNFYPPVDQEAPTPFTNTIPFWATRDEVFCIEMYSRITAYNIHSFKRRIVWSDLRSDRISDITPASSILDTLTNSVWMLNDIGLLEVSLTTGKQEKYACPGQVKPKLHHLPWMHIPDVSSPKSMCYDPRRKLIWLNTDNGLFKFSPGDKKFLHIDAFDEIVKKTPLDAASFQAYPGISLDGSGRVWIASTPKGVFIYDPDTNAVTQPLIGTARQNISPDFFYIYCDRDGIVWLSGTKKAIYQLNPARYSVTHYIADPGKPFSLSHNQVATIVNGPEGKLWIGTWDGINIFDPATGFFQVLREKDLPGFKGKNIMPLAIDTSLHKAWLKAWYPNALFEMDITTRKCRRITFTDTISKNAIDMGDMEAEKAMPFKNGFSFPLHNDIFTVNGNFIANQVLSFSSEIVRIVIAEDSFLFLKPVLARNNISYVYQNGKWALTSNPLDTLNWSNLFFNRNDQTWWVGTRGEIIHYDKSFHIIRRYSDGFPEPYVLSILADNYGNLWFVNGNGNISRLDTKSGKFLTLSERDGFQKQIFNWAHPHEKDANGDLYFGCGDGLYRVRPAKFADYYPPSSVYLESIEVNQKFLSLPGGINYVQALSVAYNENSIHIETGIMDFYSEGKSRIRYRLEEVNKNWQYGPNQFVISLEGLQPGDYKLVMQASNAVDDFDGREKTLVIHILPPFWDTWWFRGIAILFFAALFYGSIRWRLRQSFRLKLERSEKEKQLAELRQKTSELEMQALRAQMNPHFIFNSLNSINRFILQNNKADASAYLTKFSRLVRLILQNSQAALIPLESELESLHLYLELEALRYDHHFNYIINVEEDIDISAIKIPPLIIQPYAENAIWHGLMQKEEKGHLEITLFQQAQVLCCKITDDGIGRKKAAELRSKSVSSHKSMGMRITADRVAILKQKKQLDASIKITDLVSPDGTAYGTEILLKIPVMYD